MRRKGRSKIRQGRQKKPHMGSSVRVCVRYKEEGKKGWMMVRFKVFEVFCSTVPSVVGFLYKHFHPPDIVNT